VSVQLDFYSVSWKELADLIGSRNRRLARKIIQTFEEEYDEVLPDDLFGNGPTFDEGVYRWIQGDLGPPGAGAEVTQLGDALAFLALIKHAGKLAGSLSSAGTGEKLVRFLELAVQALGVPWPAEHLLARPILGFHRIHVPTWGGLSREELDAVAPKLAGDPPEDPKDVDNEGWYVDLWNALGGTSDLGKDLVTVYS
jgi:hypothetical protein